MRSLYAVDARKLVDEVYESAGRGEDLMATTSRASA